MTEEEYGLLVKFDDESPSFVHGFEAGMIWVALQAGTHAELSGTYHVENRNVIEAMAESLGYSSAVSTTEYIEWINIEFTKIPELSESVKPSLRLIDGGICDESKT